MNLYREETQKLFKTDISPYESKENCLKVLKSID
jgi:hypothetical protein